MVVGFHCAKMQLSSEQLGRGGGDLYLATSGITVSVPVPLIGGAKTALLITLHFEEEKADLQFTSSPPLALFKHFWSVLQKLDNHMMNVLTKFSVSFSCQMKVIKHVFMADDAITPYKAWIRVQINWVWDGLNGLLQCVVYLEVFLSKGVGLFSSRKQTLWRQTISKINLVWGVCKSS